MSDNDPEVQQEILAAYGRLVVENYCIIASTAFLFFDWAITFTTEVQRIWQRKFSGATVVFLLNRYVALAERVVLVVSVVIPTLQNESCVRVLRLDDTLTNMSYLMTGVFIVLRVWGIWGSDWRPHVILVPLCIAPTVFNIYQDTQYIPIAFGPPLYGCGALWLATDTTLFRLGAASGSLAIASNTMLLVLTWVKTYHIKRESSRLGMDTPLTTLLLRDGTIYFLLLFFIELFSIIAKEIGSDFVLFDVWPYFDQVFVVTFMSRFMLDLRGVYLDDSDNEETQGTLTFSRKSEARFAASVVGNFGAPLASAETTYEHGRSEDTFSEAEDVVDDVVEVSHDPLAAGLKWPQEDIEMSEAVLINAEWLETHSLLAGSQEVAQVYDNAV